MHPRGPFLSSLGLTLSRSPFLIIIGSYFFTRHISYHHQVLLTCEAHFHQSWVLLLHEAHFLSSGLTPSRSPVQQIFRSYSFFRIQKKKKNCPSIWCHHKFFQFCEDGKILPQYGISKQIFPASQRWKNFAPVWNHARRCRIQIFASVPFALNRDSRPSVEPLLL